MTHSGETSITERGESQFLKAEFSIDTHVDSVMHSRALSQSKPAQFAESTYIEKSLTKSLE